MVQRKMKLGTEIKGNKHRNRREESCRHHPSHDQTGHEPRNIINLTVCNWFWGRERTQGKWRGGEERREETEEKLRSHPTFS